MIDTKLKCVLAAACTILLSACSQSGASAGPAPVPVTVSATQGGTTGSMSGMQMIVGSEGQTARVGAPRDVVWAKLPAAYETLGVPLSFKEDTKFRLGNDQYKVRRALNGVQMRTILDCGSDLNGEKAETYDIRLTIETSVGQGASADVSDVTTRVSGLGKSPTVGNMEVPCATKGELERRILRYVRTQLGLTEK